MSPESGRNVGRSLGLQRVVWGAMLSALPLFAVMTKLIEGANRTAVVDVLPLTPAVLLAGVCAAASVLTPLFVSSSGPTTTGTKRSFSGLIVGCVFAEAVAVVGLVHSIGAGGLGAFVPYAAISLLLYVIHFPRAAR